LDNSQYIFSQDYTIRSYELDIHKQASLQTLSCFLQETAIQHINLLNMGVKEIMAKGLFWVLSRIYIRIERYPDWDEPITIQTWGTEVERFDAQRDFRILDKEQQPLCLATSLWLLINRNTNRPELAGAMFKNFIPIPAVHVLPGKLKKLPKTEEFDSQSEVVVKLRDLDFNDHVNNTRYLDWIIDSVPSDIQKNYRLASIEINYLLAAVDGDIVLIQSKRLDTENLEFSHCLLRHKDQQPYARAITSWRKAAS